MLRIYAGFYYSFLLLHVKHFLMWSSQFQVMSVVSGQIMAKEFICFLLNVLRTIFKRIILLIQFTVTNYTSSQLTTITYVYKVLHLFKL